LKAFRQETISKNVKRECLTRLAPWQETKGKYLKSLPQNRPLTTILKGIASQNLSLGKQLA